MQKPNTSTQRSEYRRDHLEMGTRILVSDNSLDAAPGCFIHQNSKAMALVQELKERTASFNPDKKEGMLARTIEEQTAKLPSDVFLWTAVGCMAASLTLKSLKQDHLSLFVGQWVAPFLLFGIYNKIVKTDGHDRRDRQSFDGGE